MSTKRRSRGGMNVGTLLMIAAIAPAIVMLIVIGLLLYVARSNEIRSDLTERGNLITAALAETSTYGVISGNADVIRSTMRGLLKEDRGIARVEVMDDERKSLVVEESTSTTAANALSFERPIRTQTLDLNLFNDPSGPHLSGINPSSVSPSSERVIGYAKVSMSEDQLVTARWRYLQIIAGMMAVAGVCGVLVSMGIIHKLRKPLNSVISALREIRSGQYDVTIDASSKGEMRELQDTIVEVAQALKATTSGLEATVAQRTVELREAIESANRSNEEKRDLIAQSNSRLEEERRRIALEIHDSMNSALIVVRLKAQHIEQLATEGQQSQTLTDIGTSAKDIANSVEGLYASAREIIKQLRPEIIDMLGLREALAELVRNYDEIHPGCSFVLKAPITLPDLREDIAIAAYRLAQESLSNTVKHAKASLVQVHLDWSPGTSMLTLKIVDNGGGFDADAPSGGSLGLVGMRERVQAINGTMELFSSSAGTTVQFRIPLPSGND